MMAVIKLLPDAPLSDATEFAFIDGRPFINAAKHEEVVARHVAEVERLRERNAWLEGEVRRLASIVDDADHVERNV